MKTFPLLILVIFTLISCGKNNNEVSYIKDVVATREGDGFEVYFVLADAGGQPTAVQGAAVVNFEIKDPTSEEWISIRSEKRSPLVDDFQKTSVGRGPFEHETILYYFGRYKDDQLLEAKGQSGRVRVTFSSDSGPTVMGNTTVYFE